jgi:hypothetical protein
VRREVAVTGEGVEIAGGQMVREPAVELASPVVDRCVLVGEVDGAEVMDDAAAAR